MNEPRPIQHTIAGVAGATCFIGFASGWSFVGIPFGIAALLGRDAFSFFSLPIIIVGSLAVAAHRIWFKWLLPSLLRGEKFARLREDRLPDLWRISGLVGVASSLPIVVRVWTSLT